MHCILSEELKLVMKEKARGVGNVVEFSEKSQGQNPK